MTLRDKIAEAVHGAIDSSLEADLTFYDRAQASADSILDVIREGVKLEWDYQVSCPTICRAKTSIGTYTIHQDEDSAAGALVMYFHLTDDGDCTRWAVEWRDYVEPEEFQAIAQADFTRRILSALGIDQ